MLRIAHRTNSPRLFKTLGKQEAEPLQSPSETMGPEPRHQDKILLVEDNAGWHRSKKAIVPEGISIDFLPPYSPECDGFASDLCGAKARDADASAPAERLWSLVDEPLVNQHFDTIDEIEEVLAKRCYVLSEMKEEICNLTNYHWLQYSIC